MRRSRAKKCNKQGTTREPDRSDRVDAQRHLDRSRHSRAIRDSRTDGACGLPGQCQQQDGHDHRPGREAAQQRKRDQRGNPRKVQEEIDD